jgi:hypothetical protein
MSESKATARPPFLVLLAVLLFAEFAVLALLTGYLIVEMVSEQPASYASALAVFALTALATVWLGVMAFHTLAGRSWIRGGALVWQVLQIAVAVGSFQGIFAEPAVGWLLLIPALIVILLLFTPSVVAATQRRDEEPVD